MHCFLEMEFQKLQKQVHNLEKLNIKHANKLFLSCCNGNQKCKQVLPNIFKIFTRPPEKGGLCHTFADGMGQMTETSPQINHKFLLKGRIKNALLSTSLWCKWSTCSLNPCRCCKKAYQPHRCCPVSHLLLVGNQLCCAAEQSYWLITAFSAQFATPIG